jgi:hypothetical protein
MTALTWNENPIKDITGHIVSANISVDGESSVRRTCNITAIADGLSNDLTNVDNLFSINKKINI